MTIYAEHEIPQVVGSGADAPSRRERWQANGPGGVQPSLPACIHFSAYEVIPCLAFSNQHELIAANERFRREGTRIVVRRHNKPVRARAHDCEQIAFAQFGHVAVERKKIARLTHRSDNIDLCKVFLFLSSLRLLYRVQFRDSSGIALAG